MPSLNHEALIELFRNRPQLGVELLPKELGLSTVRVRIGDATLGAIQPVERRADLVLDGDGVCIVLEIQLRRDRRKRRSWPSYLTMLHDRTGKKVVLVVVCLDAKVAEWAGKAVEVGPDFILYPRVIGPKQIPVVVTEAEARADPELAVLSVMAHGKEAVGGEIAEAVFPVIQQLDEGRSKLYNDLVLTNLGKHARHLWEQWMIKNYRYQSDFLRKFVEDGMERGLQAGHEKGLQEGREEGLQAGLRNALLTVLASRNLPVSAEQQAQIQQCTATQTLDQWLRQSAFVPSVEALLR